MNKNDILAIKNMIIKRINVLQKDVKNIENYVIDLGKDFGYEGTRMKLENYAGNKSGYIDVIWINELGHIKWAIPIDGGLRKRSIAKLKAVHTANNLLLYYGDLKKLRGFIKINDPNGDIKIVHLGEWR